jgi:hypothetical protein
MALNINHLKGIKIWGSYTPILGNVKKSLSFMCYWNLGPLHKMIQLDKMFFQGFPKNQFMIYARKNDCCIHELKTFWLYRHHWAPLAWAFIQTMHTIHAQDMKHYDLSPFTFFCMH